MRDLALIARFYLTTAPQGWPMLLPFVAVWLAMEIL